jgi:hypothetical protein
MKSFLGMSVLALALAGVPTQQASAWGEMHFGIGLNFSWQRDGQRCHRRNGCFGNGGESYIATLPGSGPHAAAAQPQFLPPPPTAEPGGPKSAEEATLQWGYPNLNYSYFHPVSYYPAQYQPSYGPANYYSPQYYYPPASSYPNYYPTPGVTFDR